MSMSSATPAQTINSSSASSEPSVPTSPQSIPVPTSPKNHQEVAVIRKFQTQSQQQEAKITSKIIILMQEIILQKSSNKDKKFDAVVEGFQKFHLEIVNIKTTPKIRNKDIGC